MKLLEQLVESQTINAQQQPVQPVKQTQKPLTPGVQAVVDWIKKHDPDLKLSVRETAQGAGCSTGTAHKAIKHTKQRS